MDDWKYIYIEQPDNMTTHVARGLDEDVPVYADSLITPPADDGSPDSGLTKKWDADWEPSPIELPPPIQHTPASLSPARCDEEHPRIFHMFWTGTFTDKPYLAILSFLFTQNTGLHIAGEYPADAV